MLIAFAQINPIVGDLTGNRRLVEAAMEQARHVGARLLVLPELCISGYPPKDLLLREGFVQACERVVEQLARQTENDLGLIVGHPAIHGCHRDGISNAVSLLHQGKVVATQLKVLLPNYDVFDEKRYFLAGEAIAPIEFNGLRLGLHICEDAWWMQPDTFYHCDPSQRDPVGELAKQGVDLFINISASPYEYAKMTRRHGIIRRHVEQHARPFLLVNQVGGNDDLVFDGNSFLMSAAGHVVLTANSFEDDFGVFDTDCLPGPIDVQAPSREEQLLDALTLGLKDYFRKCGFKDCVLGLSGGIDSALASAIAARALGPENVHGLLMPSRYSSEHSVADAQSLAENLGIDYAIVPIDPAHKAYESMVAVGDDLASDPGGLAEQNLQARIRGAIVMTRSNHHNWLALATGNKSELAVGYCTLYGDM
ncbi:MAG: NAD(+) synthase, partial [Planctomycetaceae bacterium]|nr:NAD(+) synthase [Planctomycetaceae bacterium]